MEEPFRIHCILIGFECIQEKLLYTLRPGEVATGLWKASEARVFIMFQMIFLSQV